MSQPDPARTVALSTLPVADVLRIEEVCTRFEAACQAGERPRIEDYCADLPDGLLQVLRLELRALEIAYRGPTFPGYAEVARIGHGGMGVVYRARNRVLHREEALKVPTGMLSPRDHERFRFEAEAVAALDHPNIVPVYGVGEVHGQPFLAMKWIEGRTLAAALPDLRGDLHAVATLLAKVARAVHHAHQRGLLHRDLKPANILLDQANEPHITDFGLARRLDSQASLSLGDIAGTPAYMAPEQARGERAPSVAVDVYGLGAILYEMLTGRPPFVGATPLEVLRLAQEQAPIPPAGTDPDLAAVCRKCLARDPTARYASAEALAEDLESWLRGDGVLARRPDLWDLARQVLARPPHVGVYAWQALFWMGTSILLVDVAILAVLWWNLPALWAWGILALRVASQGTVFYHLLCRFQQLDPRERHSLTIGLAVLAFQVALWFMYVPLHPWASSAGAVQIFPPLLAVFGLSLFINGSTAWPRLLPVGLGLIAVAPLLAWLPEWSPLLHLALVPPVLWWWAYWTWRYSPAAQETSS